MTFRIGLIMLRNPTVAVTILMVFARREPHNE